MPVVQFGFDKNFSSSYNDANFTLNTAQKVYVEFGPNVVDYEITGLNPGNLPVFSAGKGSHPGGSHSLYVNLPAGTFRAGLSRFQDLEAKGSISWPV